MLTTKPQPIQAAPALPWQQAPQPAAPAAPAGAPRPPMTMPFGKSTESQIRASAPVGQATSAVPVVGIEHIEEKQTEAAPPAPPAAGEDPVKEDPAMPTELTAPLFNAPDTGAPRTVVIRALNKVTAQSTLLEGKPGAVMLFGQLNIIPITCRVSDPTSQRDDAVLLDIKETVPGKKELMPRFKGWMYASSPSVNALEHPVYDISAVECKILQPQPKPEEKPAKNADKKPGKK